MAEFNEILKGLRSEKGMSQAEMAREIGLSKSALNMYERGERQPNFETLEIIADYFNVDIDFLLGRSDKTTRVIGAGGYYQNEETAKIAQKLLDNHDLRVLFDAAEDAPPEALKQAAQILKVLKGEVFND